MNELITINYDSEQPTVLGRDLHEALGIDSNYTTWLKRMCEYGFSEGIDYATCFPNLESENQHGGQNKIDHQLTIPMAKEICMLQRSDIGRQFRQYFIKVEEQWNTPEAVMARALKYANENLKKLQIAVSELTVDNQIMKPKAEYFDELVERNLLTSFRETAKELGIKEKAFIAFLIDHKYIYRDKKGKLMPKADKNNGLFELKECYNEKNSVERYANAYHTQRQRNIQTSLCGYLMGGITMKMPNPEKALKLYYTQTEINNAEIRELFSCNSTTATRLKKSVFDVMAERNVRTWLPGNIDVKTAFDVWKIDVDLLEKHLLKLQKLKNAGVLKE